jgi:hypothetical protein
VSKQCMLAQSLVMAAQLLEHLLRGRNSKGSTDSVSVLDLCRNVSVVEIVMAIPRIHLQWKNSGDVWTTLGIASLNLISRFPPTSSCGEFGMAAMVIGDGFRIVIGLWPHKGYGFEVGMCYEMSWALLE